MGNKKNYLALLLFIVSGLVLYYPTRHAGFAMDFVGWERHFIHDPFSAVLTSFGFRGQQQVSFFFFYLMYRLFDVNGGYWYLVFTTLHALNAWLLFVLFQKIFLRFQIPGAVVTALAGALLFFLSPYQAEVVVWKVCFQYLFTGALMLNILLCTVSYLETGKSRFLYFIILSFLPALFSFEWAFVIPLLTAVVAVAWNMSGPLKGWRKKTFYAVGAQLIFLPIYFFLNKATLGGWVSHYGQNVHTHFDFYQVASTVLKYAVKYLFFLRDFSHSIKTPVFNFFDQHPVALILFITGLLSFILVIIFYNRTSTRLRAGIFCILMFLISLIPVVNLYMSTLLQSENDRYGYFASMFFFMMLALLLFSFHKFIRYTLMMAWVIISIVLLVRINTLWMHAGEVFNGLINDFRWYDKKEVIILNIPDSYNGVWMFRIINEPTGFAECLEMIRYKPYNGKMIDVAQYNMMHPSDGVSVQADSARQLRVQFNQGGNWWWHNGMGAVDYETGDFKVHFEGPYTLTMKTHHPDRVFIYQVGDKWKEVQFP